MFESRVNHCHPPLILREKIPMMYEIKSQKLL